MELTRSELEVMDVLWNEGEPLSRVELIRRSTDKRWKESSVHILLNGLLEKKAIYQAGIVRCSKTFGRTFAPALSREQYYAATVFSHRFKPDLVGLVAALLSREGITSEQKQQIMELAEQKENGMARETAADCSP